MEGWIKLHRRIVDNPIWTKEPFTKGQAWVDILILASHKKTQFDVRGIEVGVERGQMAWGESKLAERWGWSRTKLRRFLRWLETRHQIVQEKNNVITLITVVNYEDYQEKEQQNDTTEKQQKNNRKTYTRMYKNVKEEISIEDIYDEAFLMWFAYKSEKRQSYKSIGMKTFVKKCLRDFNSPDDMKEAIEYSMSKNYDGLFSDKSKREAEPTRKIPKLADANKNIRL